MGQKSTADLTPTPWFTDWLWDDSMTDIFQTRLDNRKKGYGFFAPEDLYTKFKKHVAKENTTFPKIISQFMKNYADYLDSSFLKGVESLPAMETKKTYVSLVLNADIFQMFKEKTKKEGIPMSAAIEQFMRNYVVFMDKRNKVLNQCEKIPISN